MQSLEGLRERLLRAGIASRHVRRYIGELRDHYDDALRDELEIRESRTAASLAAWVRIGDEESLAQSMLSRPEFRSTLARFPALIFGLGSVLAWVGTMALFSFGMWLLLDSNGGTEINAPVFLIKALLIVCSRVIPVALIAIMLALAAHQRLVSAWPWVGAALVALFYGTLDYSIIMTAGRMSSVGMSSSLLPVFIWNVPALGPVDVTALIQGAARALGMLAIGAVPYFLLRRLSWGFRQRTE